MYCRTREKLPPSRLADGRHRRMLQPSLHRDGVVTLGNGLHNADDSTPVLGANLLFNRGRRGEDTGARLAEGPVARILLPRRVPNGFHATFVSQQNLDRWGQP